MNKEVNVRKNERSWAIELISQINTYVDANDFIIKRAGGESTISNGKKLKMFPDVILYEDENLSNILQGWEIKMPDVQITDELFVKDAQRKALALGLNSCVIWNFTYVKFYVYDETAKSFEVVKQWENLQITSREDVSTYKSDWIQTLKDVILNVNDFLRTHKVKRLSVGEMISNNAINILINDNKDLVAEYFKNECVRNAIMDAEISIWWQCSKMEYSFDETDRFKAYAKIIILNWAYRIIFAHLIKRTQKEAARIDTVCRTTTPEQANQLFLEITERSDFYNVFAGLKYCAILPSETWQSLVELSLFLKENGIRSINQEMLQNILENCINTTRRELNGQFTTPKVLARILASITIHDWTDDCADPCCGTGTIAHEILDIKKTKLKKIADAVNTTWAGDKYDMPLQIANLSMTSCDTINLANRLFRSNAFNLYPGKIIQIVNPADGKKLSLPIPQFGAICSNLPFVSFENLQEDDQSLIETSMSGDVLDRKSDLSYYITLYLATLIKDDGYIGIILSNSWLGTTAGEKFYNAILQSFDLKQVHISGSGRWFKNADVVTTILVLQKKKVVPANQTKFYVWKKSIETIGTNPFYEKHIVNCSLTGATPNYDIMSVSSYSVEEINQLHNLNLSYNALFHNVKWVLDIQNKMIPLTSLFDVFRGSRRGWDALFFPKKDNHIEKEFLMPALFNARNINKLITEPDCVAFSCSKSLSELSQKYPGAYTWINKFVDVKNGTNKPLPLVLKRKNEAWYEMKPNEVAQIFTMMNPNNRFFFGRFQKPSFINQRLIGLKAINNDLDLELCHALLNSILMKFFIEAVGFGRGLGVLDINKDNIGHCYLLNPELLSAKQISEIKDSFKVVCAKNIINIEQELFDPDWSAFNHTVLRAFGINDYYEQIYGSLLSMRKVRLTALEKNNPNEYSSSVPEDYEEYSMVAST